MREPRVMLETGTLIPFSALPNALLELCVTAPQSAYVREPGDVPESFDISKSIASRILRDRSA